MRTPPSPSVIVWWSFWNSAAPSTFEAVDDRELPQWACPFERLRGERGREVEQRSLVCRLRQADVANVVVEIEVFVVLPQRRSQTTECRNDALLQARHHPHGVLHGLAQTFDIRRLVEDRDVGERRGESRILLEVPHERFDVAHAPVTTDRTCRLVGHGVEATA